MLTRSPGSKVQGWCYMSRERMADEIGLSKQSIITLIAKMECAGFIFVHPVTKYLQPTDKWLEVYFTDGKESLPSVHKIDTLGKVSLPESSKETLPNNIQVHNRKENLQVEKIKQIPKTKTFKQWSELDFKDHIDLLALKFEEKTLTDFFNWWSEKDEKGKMKFQLQKTWETEKRLNTWLTNETKFNKNGTGKQFHQEKFSTGRGIIYDNP